MRIYFRNFVVQASRYSLALLLICLVISFVTPSAAAVSTTVALSSTSSSTQASTQRHIVRTSDATLHAFVQMGTNTTTCGSGGLWWLYSTNSGSTWTCGSQLNANTSTATQMFADARVDSSDNIYVVYSIAGSALNSNADVIYRKLTATNCSPAPCDWTVESAQTVLNGTGSSGDDGSFHYATLELQGTTRIWIAAREYDGTNYAVGVYYSDGLGASPAWTVSQAALDTAGTNAQYHYPNIVRFGTNIGIIFNVESGGDLNWRTRADSDGLTTWNSAASICTTGCLVRFPAFSSIGDTSGNVYLAHEDADVKFYHYFSSWSAAATITTNNVSDHGVSVATDGTDVWVLYGDSTNIAGGIPKKLMYKKGVSPFATANFDTNGTAAVSSHSTFDKIWLYDASANSYQDETTDAANTTTADIAHTDSSTIVKDADDIFYAGMSTTFDAITWVISTVSSGGTNNWEYCSAVDGSSVCTTWTTLTITSQSNPGWKGNGYLSFTPPSNWAASKLNGEGTAYYYIRDRTLTAYTIGPVGTQLYSFTPPQYFGLAPSTAGVYALWTENTSAPTKIRYATLLSHNANPSDPTSLGGHVSGAYTQDSTPTLTFTLSDPDSGDTVKYRIQIDDSSDFSSAAVDYTSSLASQGSASFTVGQAAGSGSYTTGSSGQSLSDGSFYWRVKTIDDDAAESSYTTANSGNAAFIVDATAPTTPGTPATTSAVTDTTPTWTWTASTDSGSGLAATPYTLQWSQASDFSSGVSTTTATTNSFTHSTALSDGAWYFRVKAADTLGNESGYSASGSITIDATIPEAIELNVPDNFSYTSSERPDFRWKTTSDTSGLSKYSLEIDNPFIGSDQPSGDFLIDDIPVSNTTDYETGKYTIRYEGFSDSDSTNNYISVHTKSSSEWSASAIDGKVREGRVTWKVRAFDTAGNVRSATRTLFVDRTGPQGTFTQINDIPNTASDYSTTDTTPAFYGKLTDPISGGDPVQTQTNDGPGVSSGPKQAEIKVEKQSGLTYDLVTLVTVNMDKQWFACDGAEVADTASQRCDKYVPFEYTSKEILPYGTYKITLTGIDNAGNASGKAELTIHVTTLSRITTPEEKKLIEEEAESLTPEEKETVKKELEITKPVRPGPENATLTQATQSIQRLLDKTGNLLRWLISAIGQQSLVALDFVRSMLADLQGAIQHTLADAIQWLQNSANSSFSFIGKNIGDNSAATEQGLTWIESQLSQIGKFKVDLDAFTGISRQIPAMGPAITTPIGKGLTQASQYFVSTLRSNTEAATSFVLVSADTITQTGQAYANSRNAIIRGISRTAVLTVKGMKEGFAEAMFAVGAKVQTVSDSFGIAIMQFGSRFVSTPTVITNVKVAILSPTSAKVSWETNHPANGKVNYGPDRTYPFDVQSEKRVTHHEFILKNLEPDSVYYFEVMSHNNNYVYDAYREFRTPKEP